MANKDANYWVEKLGLVSHPEGGYYRETYRSAGTFCAHALEAGFWGERNISTAIYFLLAAEQRSSFHRIRSDELWFFHRGSAIDIHCISPDGILRSHRLGADIENGESFQVVVPAGDWFGAALVDENGFGLCSCTVAPGFSFADFELADVELLSAKYPQHRGLITKLSQ